MSGENSPSNRVLVQSSQLSVPKRDDAIVHAEVIVDHVGLDAARAQPVP